MPCTPARCERACNHLHLPLSPALELARPWIASFAFGAAPMPLMDNVGLLVHESLPMVADIVHAHGLRERIRLIASVIKTSRPVSERVPDQV